MIADNIDWELLPFHLSELALRCHWGNKGKASRSEGGMCRSMQKIAEKTAVHAKHAFRAEFPKDKLLFKKFFSLTNTDWL